MLILITPPIGNRTLHFSWSTTSIILTLASTQKLTDTNNWISIIMIACSSTLESCDVNIFLHQMGGTFEPARVYEIWDSVKYCILVLTTLKGSNNGIFRQYHCLFIWNLIIWNLTRSAFINNYKLAGKNPQILYKSNKICEEIVTFATLNMTKKVLVKNTMFYR